MNISFRIIMAYTDKFTDINFVEKYIGGENNDNLENFNAQVNIINNKKTDYNRMIDYHNKLERDKNDNNNEYVERLDNEKNTTVYRINNFPTYIDDINYSNPLIYPKDYDPYFSYLDKKNINPINTQITKKKEYMNIDSINRTINASLNISKYYTVKDNGLEFKNNTNYMKIYFETPIPDNEINLDNYIILRGYKTYVNYYDNLNFFFTNDSTTVIIDLKPNFAQTISYTDLTILIEDIGSDDIFEYWRNIPYQLLNNIQKIYIINTDNNIRIAFNLPIKYYSSNLNDNVLTSSCKITFNCLGNYPINLINANTPLTSLNLSNYLTLLSITTNYIEVLLTNTISLNDNILLDGYWKNDSFFTGKGIQIGKIDGFVQSYDSANNFVLFLNKTYVNVAEIKIISSEIPNVQTNVNGGTENNKIVNFYTESKSTSSYATTNLSISYVKIQNNRLYWDNVLDKNMYFIELSPGNYTYELLKKEIEYKVSLTKRYPLIDNEYLSEYNNMEVEFIQETDESKFKMFDIYNIPNCFEEFTDISTSTKSIYKIKILCPYHNLNKGDMIFISNSLSYYVIDKKYINLTKGHIVSNVLNNTYFEIIIKNINPIESVGNTKGGFSVEIKKYSIFRLYFNFTDTIGELIGFPFVGYKSSITNYSSLLKYYTITNKDTYYINISSILIVNNNIPPQNLLAKFSNEQYTYFLLLADGLNNNNNPNGPSYFYKFLINQPPGNYLFNTFVNSPVYFNPPIRNFNELKLTLVYPDGSLVNMGNLNYSLTFEITTINNLPENTNINTNLSRV